MIFNVKDYEALRQATQALCEYFTSLNVPPESVFDSKLVAYELLGNILRHTNGEAQLKGELKEDHIELKILSESVFYVKENRSCTDVYAEHGRGLFLVDTVCEKDVVKTEDGLLVRIRIHK